jgi:catechol 2,3-dioxygenase-like lactoylglutathione lyase family enzyme
MISALADGHWHRDGTKRDERRAMFEKTQAFSGFAVKDLDEARRFYGETLGMKVSEGEMGFLRLHVEGGREILVYPKPDHQPANYTILNFPVDDVDATVDELASRGVEFERYEGFAQDERGIARGDEGPPIAWFTDPSGNILSVIEA